MKIPAPYFAYVEFHFINDQGESCDITNYPPEHLKSFTHTRVVENAANKFIVELFDETAILVEYQLALGYQNVEFKYGYVNGVESPTYSGIISEYDIDFTPGGALLTIEGYSSVISVFSSPKTCTYTGNISDIVKQIAKEEGWEIGNIVETENSMPDKVYQRNNQSAPVFIANELTPLAKSTSGNSNYQLSFEDVDGRIRVNYLPSSYLASKDLETTRNYSFTWGSGDRNSVVLEFNPDYSGYLAMVSGGATVEASTINSKTNEILSIIHNNFSDANRVVTGDKSIYRFDGATKVIGGSAYTSEEMKNIAAYMWASNSKKPITADLIIVGDPNINALEKIFMVVLNRNGLPHHSSGLYLIIEVRDEIVGGTFTSTMMLYRDAMSIGVDDSGGINVTSHSDYFTVMASGASLGSGNSVVSGSGNSDIVKVAAGQVGVNESDGSHLKYSDWYYGYRNDVHWCAIFVSWCANQAGISTEVIKKYAGCDDGMQWFIKQGRFVYGTNYGGSAYTPKAGDIIFFSWNHTMSDSDHTGIVESSDGSTVNTIEGNTSDSVARRSYSINSQDILGYGVPNYPTTNASYQQGGNNEQTIYNFLTTTMGFNKAAACGVLANIEAESGFKTGALGDSGTSYGICQWHAGRYDNLKSYCSSNGLDYTSLDGQLKYLKYELETSYTSTLNKLKSVSNDAQGAYDAAYYWCYYFEIPANRETRSVDRGNNYYPKNYSSYSASIVAPVVVYCTFDYEYDGTYYYYKCGSDANGNSYKSYYKRTSNLVTSGGAGRFYASSGEQLYEKISN